MAISEQKSLAMGAAVYYGADALKMMLESGLSSKIFAVAILVSGGLILYGGLSLVLGAASRQDVDRLLRRNAS